MRGDDARVPAVAAALHDEPTGVATDAERKVLSGLGGGCQLPLAVLAEVKEAGTLQVRAALAGEDGLRRAESSGKSEDAAQVVAEVLSQLRAR